MYVYIIHTCDQDRSWWPRPKDRKSWSHGTELQPSQDHTRRPGPNPSWQRQTRSPRLDHCHLETPFSGLWEELPPTDSRLHLTEGTRLLQSLGPLVTWNQDVVWPTHINCVFHSRSSLVQWFWESDGDPLSPDQVKCWSDNFKSFLKKPTDKKSESNDPLNTCTWNIDITNSNRQISGWTYRILYDTDSELLVFRGL